MNLVLITTVTAILALALWFIRRKRYRRVWLPISVIFTAKRTILPRLQFDRPPWFAYLCFLVIAIVLTIFTYRPQWFYQVTQPLAGNKIFMLIDFSPSVAARLTITEYRSFLEDSYTKLKVAAVSTSHRLTINRFAEIADFRTHLQKLDFHRAGTVLAKNLQRQSAELKDFDHIVIVADRDNHSWQGFFQQPDGKVSILEVPRYRQPRTNLYIDQVRNTMPDHPTSHHLDIEIARNSGNQELTFELEIVDRNNEPLKKISQHQIANERSIISTVLSRMKSPEEIVIRIVADDALELDNTFFVSLPPRGAEVTISGDLASESLIDDPLYRLQTALEVIGLRIERLVIAPANQQSALWIVAFGKNFVSREHCPDRQQARRFWLIPQYQDYHQGEACRCYLKLRNRSGSCHGLQEILLSEGAGGKIIWQHDNITLLTVSPHQLGYAQLPVLTKQLLTEQKITIAKLKDSWPRHDTFVDSDRPSNVPRGESLLAETDNLPPVVAEGQLTATDNRQDDRIWIVILLTIVIIVCLVEAGASRWITIR